VSGIVHGHKSWRYSAASHRRDSVNHLDVARGIGRQSPVSPGILGAYRLVPAEEVTCMAKRSGRPSLEYRYEHYDPR
jgi:hypothetical protein